MSGIGVFYYHPSMHGVDLNLIDTHCHIDFPAFDGDRTDVLARARRAGVTAVVVPGTEASRWNVQREICSGDPGLYPAYGLHPVFLEQHREEHLGLLEEWLQGHSAVAVGEIGLDYQIPLADRRLQGVFVQEQLSIASQFNLPVVLHVRKAHDDMIRALRRVPLPGGIVHAFNGSDEHARHYVDLGMCLGFGGMLTYQRSTRLRRLAALVPEEALVLETDAPDMTVSAHRGKRNSPEYLPYCLTALADARSADTRRIAEITTRNAHRVLSLPPGA